MNDFSEKITFLEKNILIEEELEVKKNDVEDSDR
jgi:hypothetical protein